MIYWYFSHINIISPIFFKCFCYLYLMPRKLLSINIFYILITLPQLIDIILAEKNVTNLVKAMLALAATEKTRVGYFTIVI